MENKTTLYLVRHGQTEWNVQHRMQGHQDSPLTELGVKQAEWLGEALSETDIDHIYSSSSERAFRTAELIRRSRPIDIIRMDDLRELNLGVWEGQTQAEVKEKEPERFAQFWHEPDRFQANGGESFHDVNNRVLSRLRQITAEQEGKSVLLVTHTVVLKLLMAHSEGRPMRDIWNPPYIQPACLCKVEISGEQADIILHGDISHYKDKIVTVH